MSDLEYRIIQDAFHGPLDLLLHLVKKEEVDILEISIVRIADQFKEFMEVITFLDLTLAGEFLVMAATLLHIKSRMLLPDLQEPEQEEGGLEDPRAELVRRLLEYQRYREAGMSLGARTLLGREVFSRPLACDQRESGTAPEEEVLELDLYRLTEAFNSLIRTMPKARAHEVAARDSLSMVDAISNIMALLESGTTVLFSEVFDQALGREGLIVTFLALLELCKLRMIKVVQREPGAEIFLLLAVAPQTLHDGMEASDV